VAHRRSGRGRRRARHGRLVASFHVRGTRRHVHIRYRGVRLKHTNGRPVRLQFEDTSLQIGHDRLGAGYMGAGFTHQYGGPTEFHVGLRQASFSYQHNEPRHTRLDYRGASLTHQIGSGEARFTLGPWDADLFPNKSGGVDIELQVEPLKAWLTEAVKDYAIGRVAQHLGDQATRLIEKAVDAYVAAKEAASVAEAAASRAVYDAAYEAAHAAAIAAGVTEEEAVAAAYAAGIAALEALL
jgi:hypothetical protein